MCTTVQNTYMYTNKLRSQFAFIEIFNKPLNCKSREKLTYVRYNTTCDAYIYTLVYLLLLGPVP